MIYRTYFLSVHFLDRDNQVSNYQKLTHKLKLFEKLNEVGERV